MLDLSTLKICYLAGTLGQGGAERQLYYAVQGLRRAGTAVRVLCLERGGFWEERIERLGVPVIWVGQSRSRLKRVLRMFRVVAKERPDVFQSQHFFTNGYVAVASRLLNCAAIGALRSNGEYDVLSCGRLGGWLNLRLPPLIAANSRSAIRCAMKRGVPESRLCLLPNVVDTEQFQPGFNGGRQPLTLLGVGRLTREKRFDRFLTVLHSLRERYKVDVRGLIAGGTRAGDEVLPELQRQAAALGLSPDGVQFLGAVQDLRPLYSKASVCLLTSDHEGTPNVLLEAMASGVPIVATRVGGVPEIVRHGRTGFVVSPENLAGLTADVFELLRQPDLRMDIGKRARSFVEENYSLHGIQVHLRRVYEAAMPSFHRPDGLPLPQTLKAVRPGS